MQRHVTCKHNDFPTAAKRHKLKSMVTLIMFKLMRVRFKHLQLTNPKQGREEHTLKCQTQQK